MSCTMHDKPVISCNPICKTSAHIPSLPSTWLKCRQPVANITIDGQYGIWFKRSINVCSDGKMAFSHHLVSPYNSLTPCLGVRRFFSALQCAAMLYIHPGIPAAGFINGGTPKLRLQAKEHYIHNIDASPTLYHHFKKHSKAPKYPKHHLWMISAHPRRNTGRK